MKYEYIKMLIDGSGEITIDRAGSVSCAATASDEDQCLAMLVRQSEESFEDLLARLDRHCAFGSIPWTRLLQALGLSMKLAIIVILSSVFLCRLVVAAPGNGIAGPSKIYREDGVAIHYYLEKASQGSDSETLLIALQGSDCNSVKHSKFAQMQTKSIWPLADLLFVEKPGITASLPYSSDTERPDCPAYYIHKDSPTQRAQDVKSVVDHVLEGRRYRNIIAMGGSEGATVAAIFAAESGIPDAVVLINGGGRWFLDDVLHSIRSTSSSNDLQSELNGFNGFAEHILKSEPFHLEMSGHGYGWWRSMLTIDQQSVLNEIKAPVLVVQGGRDESVSLEAVAEMVASLQQSGKNNIELEAYANLNHGLSTTDGKYMAKQVFTEINSWLKAKLQTNPNKPIQPTADALAD